MGAVPSETGTRMSGEKHQKYTGRFRAPRALIRVRTCQLSAHGSTCTKHRGQAGTRGSNLHRRWSRRGAGRRKERTTNKSSKTESDLVRKIGGKSVKAMTPLRERKNEITKIEERLTSPSSDVGKRTGNGPQTQNEPLRIAW